MDDIKLAETCPHCFTAIVLMASGKITEGKNEGNFLVKRCLNCGEFPVKEIARLHEEQNIEA